MRLCSRLPNCAFLTLSLCSLFYFAHTARAEEPDESIVILPPKISLSTPESRQRLVVERAGGEQYLGQQTEGVSLASGDEEIVRIEDGVVVPVANGSTTITAKLGEMTATASVEVSGQEDPFVWSFRNHVEPVLSKNGCNGGACHGARAGKNGFRLTLFGYDLDADYSYLTRQARGRRIVPSDPGRSLLLTKPTGLIPHKGGVRFDPGSLDYRVLAEWIAAGAPPHQDEDPVIDRVEVLPKYSRQSVGASQQLVVLAHFSDGHVEDVSRWAKYTSVNSNVASVGQRGEVQVTGAGEGAVKVWYLNLNELAFLSVPFENDVSADLFAMAEKNNFIDEQIVAKLASLNLPPSPPADDATFLRRVFLDTIGVLPTAEEAREFLSDKDPHKREKLIDELLARPEFVDYWTYKWSDLLLVTGSRLRPKAVESYYGWIRENVASNTPWDQFVRRIVTSKGSTLDNGAANFYALHQGPEDMAETVAQAFMGLSINCAKCHNHPLEKWTNDQYYGMANMFARVRAKGWGGNVGGGEGLRVVFSDTQGELIQPSTGQPQPPRPLDAEPLAFDASEDRRIYLAEWLTSPENPYFARSIVNRVWANFFGVGLVEKVDDLRVTNPASNEKLLDAAAAYLVENNYDLKQLMRAILLSAAYQRSSVALPGNSAEERFYSRYFPRRLTAEVLLDAVSQATEAATKFKDQKEGLRALQLTDANVASYFLSTFGRPERIITCECERSDEPSMTQVLHLYNGDTLNEKLRREDNRIDQMLKSKAANYRIVEDLYLRALSRYPSDSEMSRLLAELEKVKDNSEKRLIFEDLYWSVLSSREFIFNH